MRKIINPALLALVLFGSGSGLKAAEWVLDPFLTQVIFEYSYNSDPYRGVFAGVEANFLFDLANPEACQFDVTINIEDIEVDSPEVLDYLHDYEMFDVDTWPTATFSVEKCRLTGLTSFESEGTLTIRDQTNPITFPFELSMENCDGEICFHLTSEVEILRLEYGVGQGYWANTSEIPNEVKVIVDTVAVQL
ncbi:MAG: YceI family protein [Gammaproteobacteria bacterium]|nr:YceI family protein [Gammaproteobacteria bacterium]